jgi:HlyD family secretion protein
LETAQATVAQADARRDQLTSGATEAEIAAARAALADARVEEKVARDIFDLLEPNAADWQREVTKLRLWAAEKARVAAEAELALTERGAEVQMRDARAALWAASAQRDTAQAQLDLLRADPVAEEIAAAEAEVSRARAGLAAAQAALDQATLRAPFDGVVTGLETSPGEMVMPDQAVLTLADLDRLQVETTDLSERDVIQVAPGQPATVYVEGLDVEIEGRVARIAPRATTIGGDVVYTVVVELDERPSGLRWGMSVEVEITTG